MRIRTKVPKARMNHYPCWVSAEQAHCALPFSSARYFEPLLPVPTIGNIRRSGDQVRFVSDISNRPGGSSASSQCNSCRIRDRSGV